MADIGPDRYPNDTDIFRTSSGVGHHWRPGYYFPDAHLHVSFQIMIFPPKR